MLFLKRALARWVSEGYKSAESQGDTDRKYPSPVGVSSMTRKSAHAHGEEGMSGEFKNPMNITLYNATGGRIIKFHSYNRQTDRSTETTYIVSSDEDFESALSKFITLEAMKYSPND